MTNYGGILLIENCHMLWHPDDFKNLLLDFFNLTNIEVFGLDAVNFFDSWTDLMFNKLIGIFNNPFLVIDKVQGNEHERF